MRLTAHSWTFSSLLAIISVATVGCSRVHLPTESTRRFIPAKPEAVLPKPELRPVAMFPSTSPPPVSEPDLPEAPSVFSEVAAVRYAVLHSPSAFRGRAAQELALGKSEELRADRRPMFTVQAEAGRSDRLSSNRQDEPSDAGIGVFLKHRLFDGKVGWFRYLSAKHRGEAAGFERQAAQNRVAAEVRLGFARMRHWYRLSQAQKHEIGAVDELGKKLDLLTAYGLNTTETVARLRAQRHNLRVGAEEAVIKLQNERRGLIELMGAPAPSRMSLGSSYPSIASTDAALLAGQALQSRPELKAAAFALEAQRASLESVRREKYPSADLVVGVASQGSLSESVGDTWRTAGRIGISASWNALDFGRNKAKRSQEMATLHEAEAEYEQLKRTVQLDIINAVESIRASSRQHQAASMEMAEARKSLDLALEAFHNDAGDIETVIRAHRTVRESKVSESNARFRSEESQVLLAYSQGAAASLPSGSQRISQARTKPRHSAAPQTATMVMLPGKGVPLR